MARSWTPRSQRRERARSWARRRTCFRWCESSTLTDRLLCAQRQSLEVAHNGTFEVPSVEFGSYLFTQTRDVVERIAKHAEAPAI